ncbi:MULTISPECIES: bifunctional hydroxymethylpyrimidine kinase/phosphomethylpyrimidine kinase [Aerococcus]|uniref:bifunctional hydroxymethylpyrimidine kinase/phosphomethylpyrimidine kinase n=1 Tax=Aerococcus urinae (strain CCUG 59500 / ACS-120-V-Col10a) TaxID=2976812 RepID=UPI000200FB9A|nr:bifunctional hydroxymethylpyrimidine kinase/phosphomethylpyrimidine kinase [Aerococcus sp. Group 1]AEA00453.1 phosphomethylpyrimidine kinase [Aerococcus sp. Group 1]
MTFNKNDLLVYAITPDRFDHDELIQQVKEVLAGGATILQLRLKDHPFKDQEDKLALTKKIKALCQEAGVPFIIDDDYELALAVDADGLHVGEDDLPVDQARQLLGPEKIIGASAKTLDTALKAQAAGADYLGVGALYPTQSKANAQGTSLTTLRTIAQGVNIPIVGIGGISLDNMANLRDQGLAGVALISALFKAEDPYRTTQAVRQAAERLFKLQAVLTIAGSDSSGGAGIQADLKTMQANGVFGMSAITSVTAQNTRGVTGVYDLSPEALASQLQAVFEDIPPASVKIGMVSQVELVEEIAKALKTYQAKNVVVDPVMVATSGSNLIQDQAVQVLADQVFPLACLITPNIPESQVLAGQDIHSAADMEAVAKTISQTYQVAVLCKGGHRVNDANDVLVTPEGEVHWFRGERVDNPNTHGTGCTLSSAIASNLAKGDDLVTAIARAKTYLSLTLKDQLDLGQGSGPLNHGFGLLTYYPTDH